ncbi:MAG: hypothetical protein M9959_06565 [Chitinophagaceae bacterium]|nr:hypothetical protein [Chitinophagaceae bacterium]
MKRKPTNEQIKRAARLYNYWQADRVNHYRAGRLVLLFMDYYRCSHERIKQKARFLQWLDNGGFSGE